jgi:hypothetical protein
MKALWFWVFLLIGFTIGLLFLGGCATHRQAQEINRKLSIAVAKSEILSKATEIR